MYTELALVCCTNPTMLIVWGLFASICAARPVHIQSAQYRSCSTVKQRRAMGSNQKQCCGSEFTKWHDIYTPEECADEFRQNNADLLENCVTDSFIMFMTATGLENFATVIWRLHCFKVSFHGDVRGESDPRELASVNWRTLQWARGQFTRIIIPDRFEKLRDIKFWYMC